MGGPTFSGTSPRTDIVSSVACYDFATSPALITLFLSTIVILSSFLAFVVCNLLYLYLCSGVSSLLPACMSAGSLVFFSRFSLPLFYQRGGKEAHSLFLIDLLPSTE